MTVSAKRGQPGAAPDNLLPPVAPVETQGSSSVSSEVRSHADSMGGETLRSTSPNYNNSSAIKTSISRASSPSKSCRSAVIDFFPDGRTTQTPLSSVEVLERHLRESYQPSTPRRRLYLLEGTPSDCASRLEGHFKIDPTFFGKHSQSSLREVDHRANATAPLPSLIDPQKTWCLSYQVLRSFEGKWTTNWVRCAENGRRIELSRVNGALDETAIIERKASYWSLKHKNGGWDAIVVVDEPVESIEIGGPDEEFKARVPARSMAYQGGYRNFVDPVDGHEPSRTCSSPFDDMLFFAEHHGSMLRVGDDPLESTVFLQKIVASHYMMLIRYVKSLLSHLSFRLSQRTNLGELDSAWVENGWSDLQVWNWRCNKYCQRIEAIIHGLGIETDERYGASASASNSGEKSSNNNNDDDNLSTCARDFRGIQRQLAGLRQRSEALVSDFNGVAGIVLNREALVEANRSMAEARSVRVLTLLGVLFLPLSFASSLLSMTADYLPGADKSWTYFAIAVPLVACVVLLAALVSLAYGSDRSWLVRRYAAAVRRWRERGVGSRGLKKGV